MRYPVVKQESRVLTVSSSSVGYEYDRWEVKDIEINNLALNVSNDDLTLENQYGFVGIGYSF
ncbi:hypothetical protein [Persephonella sp.]